MNVDLEDLLEAIFQNLETEDLLAFAEICRGFAADAEAIYEDERAAYGTD